eukprot:gb/GECH01006838.1/.p1 GENE.gb/GECH01006838.1/~~gb/GECH01006838.1/.p1  ORF type:complete len:302 (+),score=70.42 gb/GECH01006838.1/:1-906(+)
MYRSPGRRFKEVVKNNKPLPIAGTVNAYCGLLAERAGFKAIYLSGSGVASASHGLADLAITTLNDVVSDASRITGATDLPLLVDVDTGFGTAFNIQRCVRELERVGVAAIQMEDQVQAKRCGHRPGKQVVTTEEMVNRIKAAVSARRDPDFVIMARTDAYAKEGMDSAVRRAKAYVEAGADMLFPEALTSLEEYKEFVSRVDDIPVLANITEFGKTPLFSRDELGSVGVSIALYPLSAFRAMSKAALDVYECILREGSQKSMLDNMQSRSELYDVLGYHEYEKQLDRLFSESNDKNDKEQK